MEEVHANCTELVYKRVMRLAEAIDNGTPLIKIEVDKQVILIPIYLPSCMTVSVVFV